LASLKFDYRVPEFDECPTQIGQHDGCGLRPVPLVLVRVAKDAKDAARQDLREPYVRGDVQ
jgi:hypothetical protein